MWLSSWSWGKHSWESVPLLVARGASLPGVSNGCMVVKSTVGSPFCLNPKLLRIFLVVKQDCVLTRERKNVVWGHVGERDHIKTRGYRRDISSEGCMRLMSVFPIWLEIIIWSRKPQESHLHNGASGKCLFSVESQQSNKCVRALGFAQVLVVHKAQYSWSGVNRAVNNLLFLANPNVSVALNCFCRPFYASPAPVP